MEDIEQKYTDRELSNKFKISVYQPVPRYDY